MKASGIHRAVEAAPPVTVGRGERQKVLRKQAALAHHLRISQQAVSTWVRRGWVPDDRAEIVSRLTGVPARELLNPRLLKLAKKVAA